MDTTRIHEITELLKSRAFETGFDLAGIAPAGALHRNAVVLKEWCDAGMNAGMEYLSRNIEKRTDPRLILEGAQSVIIAAINYYSERKQGGGDVPILSRYVYGEDYHEVIMEKLGTITGYLSELCPGTASMSFVDSGPVAEKAWAMKAGIGWQGKHSVIVNRQLGSFIFLGMIITTAVLEYDEPAADRCGECRLCIDACPTAAINGNRTVDARKCISYIADRRTPIPEDQIPLLRGRIAGCDICQEACPWNRHAVQTSHSGFLLSGEIQNMKCEDWEKLSEEEYKRLFGRSPLRRKFSVFKENVTNVTKWLKENKAD